MQGDSKCAFIRLSVGNPRVLHKTKLEGDQENLTFSFMQLFDLMQP